MNRYNVKIDGKDFDVELTYRSEKYFMKVNGREVEVISHKLGESRSLMLVDNRSFEVDVRFSNNGDGKIVFMRGQEIPVEVEDYNLAQLKKTAGMTSGVKKQTLMKAPMPGLVLDIKVEPGNEVKKGQALVVIEAMKMENILKAVAPAKIKKIHVSNGQSVEKDDKLIEFE